MVANERSFEALYEAHTVLPVIISESAFIDMNRWPKTYDIGSTHEHTQHKSESIGVHNRVFRYVLASL